MARRRQHTSAAIVEDESVLNYASDLYVQRTIFSNLYYSALNAYAEYEVLQTRLDHLRGEPPPPYADAVGHYQEIDELDADTRAYGTAADDAAAALILLCDGALRRLYTASKNDYLSATGEPSVDVRHCGRVLREGIHFAGAVWALANRARLIDRWRDALTSSGDNEDVQTLKALGLDPLDDSAALNFLLDLNLKAYREFEHLMLSVAIDFMSQRYAGTRTLTVKLLRQDLIAMISVSGKRS